MTKFYICTKEVAKGPYRLHEIDGLDIDTNDLIWSDEYRKNRKAIQVPELRAYFKKKAAAGIIASKTGNPSSMQKVIIALLLCGVIGLIGYYFATL